MQVVMLLLTVIFALVHSGLASLRDSGEKLIGERAFRVLFAGVSLPLALSMVVSSLLDDACPKGETAVALSKASRAGLLY